MPNIERSNHAPRQPTTVEGRQLAQWIIDEQGHEADDPDGLTETAYVAVFDHYVTSSPGYVGKAMSVVWDGSPTQYNVFTWNNGDLVAMQTEVA